MFSINKKAVISAASTSTVVTADDICARNEKVMRQLYVEHLQAVDVCALRKLVASYVSKQSDAAHLADRTALHRRAQELAADSFWPGEDIVLAASDCLQRPILVYVAHGTSSPIQYLPSSSISTLSLSPIRIAFIEPGHYMTVISAPTELRETCKQGNQSFTCKS